MSFSGCHGSKFFFWFKIAARLFNGHYSTMTDKPIDDDDQRVCDEFLYLLDRGQQLFFGLRDLSDFGGWETYFQRTFEVYTRVCKL